jgi:UDP-N-acetyl-D-glucosamine dehydrogenase
MQYRESRLIELNGNGGLMLNNVNKGKTISVLRDAIFERSAKIGVIGLGYVGLPLAAAIARAGFVTVGFDIDTAKVNLINAGTSYIDAVESCELAKLKEANRFRASADFTELSSSDVIIICVPTPLTSHREPDLSYIEGTARTIGRHLRQGHVVVLESTSFPGTTVEIVKPILEKVGLKSGEDFFLGFSPEREDPGNIQYQTASIPKVVSGDGPEAKLLIESFYSAVVRTVVAVSSPAVAEATKITENIFRAVNVALVNELKIIYGAMGIDIWEVIDAAATKPFGYMPFYPGPGLGGHCIPIDPFYLTWKAKEYEISTRFIELAGEINVSMPRYVIGKLEVALDHRFKKSIGSARILLLGLAYKKNVADTRESPSLKIMDLLETRGAKVDYHDSYVPVIPSTREHPQLTGRTSIPLKKENVESFDAIIVATDHDNVDYALIAKHGRLLIDTRNVFGRRGLSGNCVIKA